MASNKRTRLFAHEVDAIVAKRNERLFAQKAKRLAREEKLAREIAKTEAQLEKLKSNH